MLEANYTGFEGKMVGYAKLRAANPPYDSW